MTNKVKTLVLSNMIVRSSITLELPKNKNHGPYGTGELRFIPIYSGAEISTDFWDPEQDVKSSLSELTKLQDFIEDHLAALDVARHDFNIAKADYEENTKALEAKKNAVK